MNPVWCVLLVSADGASLSCHGKDLESTKVRADEYTRWFHPAWRSDPYLCHESTRYPGLFDASLPQTQRDVMPGALRAKFERA